MIVTTEEFMSAIKAKMFVHREKDDNHELAENLGIAWGSENAYSNFLYRGTEIELSVEIDTETGRTRVVAVNGARISEYVEI